jgi:quercetin dioxygenase-like cupin family protein
MKRWKRSCDKRHGGRIGGLANMLATSSRSLPVASFSPPAPASPHNRPTISGTIEDSDGRHFTVTFAPGQVLPRHRNASRILITAVRGSGTISLSDGPPAALAEGARVQLDPDVPHALVAGEGGLEITVHLIAGCCGVC